MGEGAQDWAFSVLQLQRELLSVLDSQGTVFSFIGLLGN